jgi:hypothetical protein
MDLDAIDGALHEISMMVSVLLTAAESLMGSDATPDVYEMPRDAGELLSFSAFDIDKRVNALRDAVCPMRTRSNVLALVRDPA